MVVYEDFTRYTEYDPNDNVSVVFNSITATGLRRDGTAYVRQDYGTPAQFNSALSHNFDVKVTTIPVNGFIAFWMVNSDAANNTYEKAETNADGTIFYAFRDASNIYLYLRQTGAISTGYAISLNTNYYITITRSGTTTTAYIYSDSARTVLLSTLTRTSPTTTYRYLYALASRDVGVPAGALVNAVMSNLDTNCAWTNQTACELGGCYWWAGSCHEGPRFPYDDLTSGYLAQFQNTVIKGIYSVSGDYRTVHVNQSGHVLTDIEIDVSSGIHVVQESGAFVQISGQHIYVESGAHVVADIEIVASSGLLVQISGQHVFVESGVYLASGLAITVESGLGVSISGQHVYVESGVYVVADIEIVASSGLLVQISGQHVYVESGVYVASGLAVIPQSGLGVLISGQHVYVESGVYHASGLHVVQESGAFVQISGQHVYVESGVYLASGLYLDGAVSISGNIVTISGNIIDVASGVYLASVAPDIVRSPCVLTIRGGIAACSGTQLPSNAVESVIIRNLGVTNTAGCSGSLYISGEQVWLGNGTSGVPCSGCGMLLQSGEVITLDIENMNKVYAWSETSGTQIALIGTDIT